MSDSEDIDTMVGVGRWFLFGLLALALVIAVIGTELTYCNPRWRDADTRATEKSYTFVQSKKELLIRLVQDIRKTEMLQVTNADNQEVVRAMKAQRKALIDRVRSEAASIAKDQIPSEVIPFLGE